MINTTMDTIPSYKDYRFSGDDWIDLIPAHWRSTSLGTISTRKSLRNRPDLPLLSVLREKGVVLRSSLSQDENHNYIPDDLSNYQVANEGDLVVNKMKAWQGSVGIAPQDGIVSPAYYIFELAGIKKKYAHRLLRSRLYADFFGRASDGVRIGQWDLGIPAMKSIPLVIPPPAEQDAIARYLDEMDRRVARFICNRRRLIEVFNEQKQAIINRAVTRGLDPDVSLKPSGIDWLGDIPEHWNIAKLASRYHQCLGKMVDSKRFRGDYAIPYLRNIDVQWDQVNTTDLPVIDIAMHERERFTVRPGDMLVCEGGDVGRSAFWDGQLPVCGFQKALHRLRPLDSRKDYPRFLFYCMFNASKLGVFIADGSENTFAHLTGVKLRAHRFAFPPRDEQQAIAEYLDNTLADVNRTIGVAEREIDLIREYRTRLISDVVTGKVDVRHLAPPPGREDLEDMVEELEPLDEATGELDEDAFAGQVDL